MYAGAASIRLNLLPAKQQGERPTVIQSRDRAVFNVAGNSDA